MEREQYARCGRIGPDYSRTCEGCRHVEKEDWGKGLLWYRCNETGPHKGYTVSDKRGRFLPYVPAWCPMMEANLKK